MARKRGASLETTVKRTFMASIPVVLGMGITGLIIYYFGSKPVIKEAASGLNGTVSGQGWFSGWFG